MYRLKTFVCFGLAVAGAVVIGAYSSVSGQQAAGTERPTVFEGARLIVGNASAPIERSAFVIQGRQDHCRRPRGRDSDPGERDSRRPHRQDRHAGDRRYAQPYRVLR